MQRVKHASHRYEQITGALQVSAWDRFLSFPEFLIFIFASIEGAVRSAQRCVTRIDEARNAGRLSPVEQFVTS